MTERLLVLLVPNTPQADPFARSRLGSLAAVEIKEAGNDIFSFVEKNNRLGFPRLGNPFQVVGAFRVAGDEL